MRTPIGQYLSPWCGHYVRIPSNLIVGLAMNSLNTIGSLFSDFCPMRVTEYVLCHRTPINLFFWKNCSMLSFVVNTQSTGMRLTCLTKLGNDVVS